MIAAWLAAVSPIPSVTVNHLGFSTEGTTVHLVYRDTTTVKYRRSTDEGATFSTAVDVATSIDEVPLTQCIASNGATVHTVYTRDVDDVSNPPKLYYKRSTDSGATWGSEVEFDDGSDSPVDDKYRVSLLADGVYAHCFWTPNDGELWYARSTDNGVTWSTKVQVMASATAGRPEGSLDGTCIHLTWTDTRHGSTANGGETYYTKSIDRGVTWLPEQRITSTANQDTLRPTVTSNGPRVVLAWQWPIFSEDIIYTYSTDNGGTWQTEAALTTGGGYEHAALEYQNEVFALCYTNNTTDVTFTRLSRDGGVTWETAQQPYVPSNTTTAPLIQFSTRFLIMVDRQNVSGGTKLLRSAVFQSDPSTSKLLDDFNRADDPTPPPGTNWTNGVVTFGASDGIVILSNAACRRSAGAFRQGGYWNANNFTDVDVVADLSGWANTTSNSFAIYARLQQIALGTTDGYTGDVTRGASSTEVNVWRTTNGSASGVVAPVIRTVAANDRFALSCRGDLIIVWQQTGGTGEWTQVKAIIDATYTGPGRVGLEFTQNQVTRVTNLWATEVHELVCDPGEYLIAGEEVELESGFSLDLSPGNYATTGSSVTFLASQVMTADPGAYVVTGAAAELSTETEFAIFADPGVYAVSGADASLIAAQLIEAVEGQYAVTGRAAILTLEPATQGGVASAGDRTTTYAAGGDRRADP